MKKVVLTLIGILLATATIFSTLCSCSSDEGTSEPMLVIKFKFDPNQVRLNNFGQPSTVAAGHAALSPDFNTISAHYIELAPNATTQLGYGAVIYHAPETDLGGTTAIDFSRAKVVSEGEAFLKIPLRQLAAGSYTWARVSLSYQNFDISVRQEGIDYMGTLASFVGYNNYIGSHSIGNTIFNINQNRPQGYWAFALHDYPYSSDGQAPPGATTVPNPLASTSPIPLNSCVVTGHLTITGSETDDVVITMSLSINNSFEWVEVVNDGKFEPSIGEYVIDMGLRGLIPSF